MKNVKIYNDEIKAAYYHVRIAVKDKTKTANTTFFYLKFDADKATTMTAVLLLPNFTKSYSLASNLTNPSRHC